MLHQLLVAGAAALICITIHALVMTLVVRVARHVWTSSLGSSMSLVATMVATAAVLMMAHGLEVAVWARTYEIVGAVPAGADAFYFAFVNYTTLGYGDIVPVPAWRLLGPGTAMSGMFMFGWSTAVIFEVLRKSMGYDRAAT